MKISKKIIVGVVVLAIAGGIGAIIDLTEPTTELSPESVVVEQADVEETPDVAVVESVDIQVESQIVKRVGKKYRYFFMVSNKDDQDFNGKVSIKGKTGSGSTVISSNLDFTDKPLAAGASTTTYSDANSGPKQVAGEYGASTFTFTATLEKDEVAQGSGDISEKLEDLSN